MGILGRVFSKNDWRDELDVELVRKLEKLLKRTQSYEDAYQQADNPAMAQIWVVVADMYTQIEKMNGRIRKLEAQQKQLMEGEEDKKLPDRELRDSLDTY